MREQVEGIGVPDLDSWPTRNLLDIGPAHALHRLVLVVEVGAAREKSESERQRKAKLVHTNLDVPKDGEVPSLARRRPSTSRLENGSGLAAQQPRSDGTEQFAGGALAVVERGRWLRLRKIR